MKRMKLGDLFEGGREITNIFDDTGEEHIELDHDLVAAIVAKNNDGTFTSVAGEFRWVDKGESYEYHAYVG